jgi:hypothetical protein
LTPPLNPFLLLLLLLLVFTRLLGLKLTPMIHSYQDSINSACDWETAMNDNVPLSAACDEYIAEMHATVQKNYF